MTKKETGAMSEDRQLGDVNKVKELMQRMKVI